MAEAGILREGHRVELVDGEIIEMNPIGVNHANCVARLTRLFAHLVQDQAVVWVQNPLHIDEHSELQPGLLLLKPEFGLYSTSHPTPGDVLLLIEVSDTSRAYDRGAKLELYAQARIPEVWVVDLPNSAVESFRLPRSGRHEEHQVFGGDGQLTPLMFPNLRVAIAEIV